MPAKHKCYYFEIPQKYRNFYWKYIFQLFKCQLSSHLPRELQLSDQISCYTGVSIVIVSTILYYQLRIGNIILGLFSNLHKGMKMHLALVFVVLHSTQNLCLQTCATCDDIYITTSKKILRLFFFSRALVLTQNRSNARIIRGQINPPLFRKTKISSLGEIAQVFRVHSSASQQGFTISNLVPNCLPTPDILVNLASCCFTSELVQYSVGKYILNLKGQKGKFEKKINR